MSNEEYYARVKNALEEYAVNELVSLWQNSLYLGSSGAVARTLMQKAIPMLAKKENIKINEKTSFLQFANMHYEKQYTEKCLTDPLSCVKYFAGKGDKELLEIAMQKATKNVYLQRSDPELAQKVLEIAVKAVAREGHLSLLKSLFQKAQNVSSLATSALHGAIETGKHKVVEYLLAQGAISNGNDLEIAARKNDLEMVDLLIEYGNKDWIYGQSGARKGGHKKLREFFRLKLAGIEPEMEG